MTASCRWFDGLTLPNAVGRRALCERAHADIGVEELSANSSPYIDETLRLAGTEPHQPWCAAIAYRWAVESGAPCPPKAEGPAAVASWVAWAKRTARWREPGVYTPRPGDFVVYAHSHIGVVVRVMERGQARSIEGNTSWSGFSREGVAVDYKPVASGVAGYIAYQP